ncbi:hypothetical protein TrVE_jg3201 [Triparma verrucosa]|uniref:Uncharacterized protein n=1 Tax=Triparma verrucosa TaxID=1606542 RepID=A0A9W7CD13_9STRA|nr:hypothetical protein TrVE_jg3201 [Triparma verrucosa]
MGDRRAHSSLLRLPFLLLLTLAILKITTSTSLDHPIPPQPASVLPKSSNDTDNEPIFTLQLDVDSESVTLTILEDEDPEDAVLKFCEDYGLDQDSYAFLVEEVINSGLFEVEDDDDEEEDEGREDGQDSTQQEYRSPPSVDGDVIHQIPVSSPDGKHVGTVMFTSSEEPADVAYNFVKDHGLDYGYKNLILEAACEVIDCEREEAMVFDLAVDLGLEAEVHLTIFEGEDAREAVISFCGDYGIGEEDAQMLIEEVKKEGIEVLDAGRVVWQQDVSLEAGVSLGTVYVHADEEPADAISAFLYENMGEDKLESLYDRALEVLTSLACKTVPCTRLQPLIWSENVEDDEGNYIGTVEVLEGVEPIDAIAHFCSHFQLSVDYRAAILEACCEEVECTRVSPRVYQQRINDESGNLIGNVEILEGEEVVDAVVKFVIDNQVTLDIIALKNHFFQTACDIPGTVCTRNKAKLWEKNIVNHEKESLGMMAIMDDREPVDQIWDFLANKIEDEYDRTNFFFNMKPVICEGKYVICSREAPLIFGPQPMTGPEGVTVGALSVMLGEEPIDATYKLFARAGLFEKKWDFRAVFDQICAFPGLEGKCLRQEALKYSKRNATVGDVNIGDIAVWEHEEVIDVCYRKRIEYNLTVSQQMELFNGICALKDVYCERSRAVLYQEVVNKRDYDYEEYADNNSTCPRKYCGWRFIAGWEGPINKVIAWLNEDGNIDYFTDPRFVLGMLLGLAFANRVLVSVLFRVPPFRRFRKRAKGLGMREWAILFSGGVLLGSFIYSAGVEPTTAIDSSLHAFMGKMEGPVQVLEGEQVADAVLHWALVEEKKHHPLLRKHIHWSLIDNTCARKDELQLEKACQRRKAFEKLDFGSISYWGQEHKLTYWKNPNATMEEEIDAGRVEDTVDEICERLVPPMDNCNEDVAIHMIEQYEAWEENRQEQKSVYAKIGVCADATAGEIYIAAGKTFNKLGSNYVPFARVDNGTTNGWTTTYHPWDTKTMQAQMIMDKLPELLNDKDREWYDKPCEPVFGGAMCAKKDAKGNMMIEMG